MHAQFPTGLSPILGRGSGDMSNREITIEIAGTTAARNQNAADLRSLIEQIAAKQNLSKQINIDQKKDRSDTQDFGATLIVVLGTPAAIAIAKGVHDFIAKIGDRVTIKHPNGEVIATGDAAKNIDIAATIKSLQSSANEH